MLRVPRRYELHEYPDSGGDQDAVSPNQPLRPVARRTIPLGFLSE
jgi:hypothetical protein